MLDVKDDSTVDAPRPQPGPVQGHGQFPQAAGPSPQYIGYATPVMIGYRTGGLMVFGIISMILGAIAGCGALMTPVALVATRMQPAGAPRVDVRSVGVGLVTYAAVCAAFVTLGIGSVTKKRWVRPVVLCVSLPALVMGVFGYAVMLYLLPELFRPIPGQPPIPPGMIRLIRWTTAAFALIAYVILPAAYFLFYRSPKVRDTLDALDPQPRWTDRAPLPVLGLSIWLALGCVMAGGSLIFPIVPVYGRYVTGAAAMALAGGVMLLLAIAAVLTYRVNVAGWWIALVLLVGVSTTYAYTFYTRGMVEYYRQAGFDDEEVQMLTQVRASGPRRWETLASLLPAVVAAGYLLWVYRYFTSRQNPESTP